MLRRKRRNVGSQTERRACPRLLSHGQTFEKPKIVIFLLVTIVSMIVPLTVVSLASAQQPAPQATGAVDSNGFPLKAPPGWNQKQWDENLQYCRNIAEKARANQPLDKGEIAGSGMCASLSVEFFSPQGPPPGSYISPDRPHSAPSPTSLGSPQSENTASNLSVLSASSIGPVGVSFPGGGENACTTGQSQPPDVAADVSATVAVVKSRQIEVGRFVKGFRNYIPGLREPSLLSARQYLPQLFGTEGRVSDEINFRCFDSAFDVSLACGRVAHECVGS
jgi:hypothetical protein